MIARQYQYLQCFIIIVNISILPSKKFTGQISTQHRLLNDKYHNNAGSVLFSLFMVSNGNAHYCSPSPGMILLNNKGVFGPNSNVKITEKCVKNRNVLKYYQYKPLSWKYPVTSQFLYLQQWLFRKRWIGLTLLNVIVLKCWFNPKRIQLSLPKLPKWQNAVQ